MALAHQLVTATTGTPTRWIYFLHGILGSGTNWRTFARRVVQAHPSWGAALVDLRMHGQSQGLPPPHTVAAAAEDLRALEAELPGPVEAVLGHSFGGKVLLAYLERRETPVQHAFLLDSNPGPRVTGRGSETTLEVLAVLRRHRGAYETKPAFIQALRDGGIERSIAEWLAMNLVSAPGGGYAFALDLTAIQALLDDYFELDLWRVIEGLPEQTALEVVVGTRSTVFDETARAKIAAIAARHPNVRLEYVPAGHWVHVDAPEDCFRIVDAALATTA